MFGTKQSKEQRLEQFVDLLEQHPNGLPPIEIARRLGVERSTIHRDLVALEERGVLLAEDKRARVSIFRRIFGKN
jgi:DNA-binding IclR family transcriptional regulator